VARAAWRVAAHVLEGADIALDIAIFDREGRMVGQAHTAKVHAAPPER
jgi:cobalt-precorrin-5B (C1)-methyltransferase